MEEIIELKLAIIHCEEIIESLNNCKCKEEHVKLRNWLLELLIIKEKRRG